MSINIRTKGQTGEREVADRLNYIINDEMKKFGLPLPTKPIVQRNQNQSAVGGNDLTNVMGLSIEVKRQETLSVNSWWAQTVAAAKRNCEFPVLVYRQNRKAWHVVMLTWASLPGSNGSSSAHIEVRSTIEWETFLSWFRQYVQRKLQNGEVPRS